MNKVDFYYDLIDEAAMIHFEKLGTNYMESLEKVTDALCNDNFDNRLDDDGIKRLEEIFKIINHEKFYNEEIRLAIELLIIKAFKHINYRLDLMTPDTVNYIISHIINKKFANRDIIIMDTLLGTANLIQAISNLFPNNCELIGIENDLNLVNLAKMSANLQNNEIKIYYQDALNTVFDLVDIIIADLDSYNYQGITSSELYLNNVRYFPYLLIEARLKNLKDNGYFIYVIENDFFSQENVNVFKKYLSEYATLLGLIVLPKLMFKENHIGKSIVIGKKAVLKNYQMAILEVPGLDENSIIRVIQKIDKLVELI